MDFIDYLNRAHPSINFTSEWSRESISFLDTHVSLRDGCLITDSYVKPTDTHQHLASSCHPRYCKEAIPFSQTSWMGPICSSVVDFQKKGTELRTYLQQGCQSSFTQGKSIRASLIWMEDTLTPRMTAGNSCFFGSYLPLGVSQPACPCERQPSSPPCIWSLNQSHTWTTLIAYCRPKNHQDLLVSAQLTCKLTLWVRSTHIHAW